MAIDDGSSNLFFRLQITILAIFDVLYRYFFRLQTAKVSIVDGNLYLSTPKQKSREHELPA
jgi:hypothetical protein